MERNYDLADMLVSYQREEAWGVESGITEVEIYYYQDIRDPIIVGGDLTISASGPAYYCAPYSSGDLIICGAWAPL